MLGLTAVKDFYKIISLSCILITPCLSMGYPDDFEDPSYINSQGGFFTRFVNALLFPASEEESNWQNQFSEEQGKSTILLADTDITHQQTVIPIEEEQNKQTVNLSNSDDQKLELTEEDDLEEIKQDDNSALLKGLMTKAESYTQEQNLKIQSYALPKSVTIKPFSTEANREFNDLYHLIADNFYTTYSNESDYKNLRQQAAVWLARRIEEKQEAKKSFEEQNTTRTDGILKTLESTIKQLQKDIETYELLFKEVLYDFDQTQTFMSYTLKAIQDTENSIDSLQGKMIIESNPQTYQTYEKQVTTLETNIKKFKNQILSAEALIHAKYPFHRVWESYIGGWVKVPNRTKHAESQNKRFLTTDVYSLPTDMILTREILTDTVGDIESHYHTYLKAVLSEDAVNLKLAKDEGRMTIELLLEEEKS